MPSIHEVVAAARRRLYDAGIPRAEADLDARLLLERLMGWDAARVFAHGDQPASDDVLERYRERVDRRVRREPVAYITGQQEFWDLTFEVTPAVLIPRPETELIVESVLARFPDRERPLAVADVCTGSGCLAVAIARERSAATVAAIDISPPALEVAARNIAQHGVSDRVTPIRADLLEDMTSTVDLIVSNPPYVPDGDLGAMQPEVVDYEPHVALFAGPDGLAVIRRLVAQAVSHLVADGTLMFEFGFGQADAVRALIQSTAGLALEEIKDDLQAVPRMAVVRVLKPR